MKKPLAYLVGVCLGLCLTALTCSAQTTTIPETNANTLAGAIMGPGYAITSATVTTATPTPTGRFVSPNFTVTSPPNINLSAGTVLSSSGVDGDDGDDDAPPSPSTAGQRRERQGGIGRLSLGLPGDPAIDAISGGASFDAVSLTVTFIPATTRAFNLRFVFATNESVPAGPFNDAAAILISGPGISGTPNIALLPEAVPVTVNNLDGSAAHIEDAFSDAGFSNITTPLLTQPITVLGGEEYTLRIIVADVEDSIVRSAIFVAPGQVLVNGRVNLVVTGSVVDVSSPCSGYAGDLVITAVLTNRTSSPVTLSDLFF